MLKFGVKAARYGKVRAGPRKRFQSSALVGSWQRSVKKKLAARLGKVRGVCEEVRSLPWSVQAEASYGEARAWLSFSCVSCRGKARASSVLKRFTAED